MAASNSIRKMHAEWRRCDIVISVIDSSTSRKARARYGAKARFRSRFDRRNSSSSFADHITRRARIGLINSVCSRTAARSACLGGSPGLRSQANFASEAHAKPPEILVLATSSRLGALAQENSGREFKECDVCPLWSIPAGNFTMGSPVEEAGRFDTEGPRQSGCARLRASAI